VGSTVTALLAANGGKPPASGKELWQALSKLGPFAQLPVIFSAVRLDSGTSNPRIVLAPVALGLSEASVTGPNLNGRLYFGVNMEKGPKGGDPFVGSVEFISWNTLRRKFDFGVIENVGTDEPRLRIVEGGRCFSCHKNKGPILGLTPWTNSTHHSVLRQAMTERYGLVDGTLAGAAGPGQRDRIDGMALAAPQAQAVDAMIRLGASLPLQRDTFRLMTRYDLGRKAFVTMLVAAAQPGALDANELTSRTALDQWGRDPSYLRFAADWVGIAKTTNTGLLNDYAPAGAGLNGWNQSSLKLTPVPAPPPGGFRTAAEASSHESTVKWAQKHNAWQIEKRVNAMGTLAIYDAERANGHHGVPSSALPSNPKAFAKPPTKAPQKPSDLVNPLMMANTIGLTEGDRKFMADALTDAARTLSKQKVTTATLAKEVFTGPDFADVLGGGPLPDRDEFKDRFVAGLNTVLTTKYTPAEGFAPERTAYASGPHRDPKAVEEVEAAVVPTSACLRCHEVRAGPKERLFEPIPALRFDPMDKRVRAEWARTADPKSKQELLARLQKRVFTDADMPPQDSPEYKLFRTEQAAAFDDLKRFLDAELDKPKKK
jgi:hypothetical protein